MEHGHWPMGLGLVQQAANVDPRDARIAENLGYDYSYLRRYPDAMAAYDRAAALGPTNLDVLQHRAQVDLDNGSLTAAQALARTLPPMVDSATFLAYWVTRDYLGWILDPAQQRRVMTLTPDAFDGDRVAWGLALAQTAHLLHEPTKVHAYADSARLAADERLSTTTDQPQLYASRGLALAYLGRHDDAIRDGQHAVSMLPIAINAFPGPHMVYQLAEIYLLVGEPERAIDQLQIAVTAPYYVGPGALALDPFWTQLRTNLRFHALIAAAAPRA
jgi:serine/threonine-protein kinase